MKWTSTTIRNHTWTNEIPSLSLSTHIKFQWQIHSFMCADRSQQANRLFLWLFIEIQFVYNLFSLIFDNLFWLPSVFLLVLLLKCLLPSEIIALVLSFAHSCSLSLSFCSTFLPLFLILYFISKPLSHFWYVYMSFAVPF